MFAVSSVYCFVVHCCHFVLFFLLAIALTIPRFTVFDCPFGIFKVCYRLIIIKFKKLNLSCSIQPGLISTYAGITTTVQI